MSKRRFGRIRRLPSGRWQARYRGPDDVDRPAPFTFATKTDADLWLNDKEGELRRHEWIDPDAAAEPLSEYAVAWINERASLKPRTRALYRSLFRLHLRTDLGDLAVDELTPQDVRRWRQSRLDAGVGPVTVAKAYRLLRAVMNTAVDDGLIRRNPCRIVKAGFETTPERRIATLDEVFAIADNIEPRYKALVLLATFASLRWGELIGLQRADINLTKRQVYVRRTVQEVDGRLITDTPKSDAGYRTIAIPELIIPDLRWHLRCFAEPGTHGRVFIGPKGATPRRSNFQKYWRPAITKAGVPDLHIHDLRHTGATLAASAGASLRELMERLGHSSPRAALIYQHASDARDQAIADAIDKTAQQARTQSRTGT